MSHFRRTLATADTEPARLARRVVRSLRGFEVPAPKLLLRPLLALFIGLRAFWHWVRRVFVAQPIFRAYCTEAGPGLRTDIYVHWVQGQGRLVLGNRVQVSGKCSFSFASRYADDPTLEIGDDVWIGHGCAFTVAQRITIGRHTLVASEVRIMDASGHPMDPDARRQGLPTPAEKIRPVTIGENVWIGTRVIILPGTSIGDNTVIQAGAVVSGSIPPNVLVGGNPAQILRPIGATP